MPRSRSIVRFSLFQHTGMQCVVELRPANHWAWASHSDRIELDCPMPPCHFRVHHFIVSRCLQFIYVLGYLRRCTALKEIELKFCPFSTRMGRPCCMHHFSSGFLLTRLRPVGKFIGRYCIRFVNCRENSWFLFYLGWSIIQSWGDIAINWFWHEWYFTAPEHSVISSSYKTF